MLYIVFYLGQLIYKFLHSRGAPSPIIIRSKGIVPMKIPLGAYDKMGVHLSRADCRTNFTTELNPKYAWMR